MLLPIPDNVHMYKYTLITGGVTYTLQKATLEDKSFVLSCWDDSTSTPNSAGYNLTNSQYFDKFAINKTLMLRSTMEPGTEENTASVYKIDGVPTGYVQSIRIAADDGTISSIQPWLHIHSDFRGQGKLKYLMGMVQFSQFHREQQLVKGTANILDSAIGMKKVYNDINATFKSTSDTPGIGIMHEMETSKSNWDSYINDKGWEFSYSTAQSPISDAKWQTPEVTIARSGVTWNREF